MADAVVVGSGPNGLTAANRLADHGWEVTVLEAADTPGGAVRSGELIEPGWLNDWCSAFYPLAAASPSIVGLGLEEYGLRWLHAPLVLAHPTRDGTCPVISRDLAETVKSLEAAHPGDGDAWRRLFEEWDRLEDSLLGAMLGPFPPVKAGAQLVSRITPQHLVRFARFCLLPVRRMGEEEFVSPQAQRLLAGAALHADFFPESTLSGFFGWLMCALGQKWGFPVPAGGAGELSGSMVRRLQARGGQVVCGAPVTEIVVRGGRALGARLPNGEVVSAERAVLADTNAPLLYRSLVASRHLPSSLLADLEKFDWDDATVKVDWNLNGPVPWTAPEARRAGTIHVAEGVDALTVSASQIARGLLPSDPFLLIGQQSMIDPSRQPHGGETLWAYTHVPRQVKGDAGDAGLTGSWEPSEADRFADRMEAEIEALAPGFRSLIRARHIQTPPVFEAENANLNGGAISGGTAQLHQQLVFRPTPGLGRPETPVPGLFLASSSAHPGGGVHGAAGTNAARAALAADQRRRAKAFLLRR